MVDNRLMNLCVTIDKIKYLCLSLKLSEDERPLILIDAKEVMNFQLNKIIFFKYK